MVSTSHVVVLGYLVVAGVACNSTSGERSAQQSSAALSSSSPSCSQSGAQLPACDPCAYPDGYGPGASDPDSVINACVKGTCTWACRATKNACDSTHPCVESGEPNPCVPSGGCETTACNNECTAPLQLGALVGRDASDAGLPTSLDELADYVADAAPGSAPLVHSLEFYDDPDGSAQGTGFLDAAAAFTSQLADSKSDLYADSVAGRVPIVALGCEPIGADAGSVDPTIEALAQAYGSYQGTLPDGGFGTLPVIVRYCFEMNSGGGNSGNGGTYEQFKSAWRHLHDQLTCDQNADGGTTNVYWFFCPAGDGDAANGTSPWYPGDAYVDFAGFDAFDRQELGLAYTLGGPYQAYGMINKPFIIGATGSNGLDGGDQASYLDSAAATTLFTQFPKIVALDVFDSAGKVAGLDYRFSTTGLKSFVKFAAAVPKVYGQ